MSSFNKVGERQKVRDEKRSVKRHMKAMYKIMDEVKLLAKEIHESDAEWTEDNIVDVASEFSELTISDMEKFLLLGNLQLLKNEVESDNA